MPGLVNREFRAIWQADRREQPPALVGHFPCHFDSPGPQVGEGGLDVITHEVKLVAAFAVGRVDSELGRRQGEDKPAAARVCRRHAKHVREEGPNLLGLSGEHDGVHSGDHPEILAAPPENELMAVAVPGYVRRVGINMVMVRRARLRAVAPGMGLAPAS